MDCRVTKPYSPPCSPPSSFVHGIFQARTLEQVALSFSREYSQPKGQICISCVFCIARWILYHCISWEAPLSNASIILKFEIIHPWVFCYTEGKTLESDTWILIGISQKRGKKKVCRERKRYWGLFLFNVWAEARLQMLLVGRKRVEYKLLFEKYWWGSHVAWW